MNKILVIDLLNKIANGEEVPKRIRYIDSIWEYNEETKDYIHDDLWLIYSMNSIGLTEIEVEVIEYDKKIEKISWKEKESLAGFIRNDNDKLDILARRTEKLKKSLNEIIDYINGGKDEE